MPPLETQDLPQQLPRVLLIDDDAISREVLSMLLEMHGFAVDAVEDGKGALAHLANGTARPEAILMDAQMPGLSGLNLVQALRDCSEARILAISGSEPGEAIRRATDGFILKPFQAEDVVAALEGEGSEELALPYVSGAELVDPVVLGKLKAMMPVPAVREIYVAVASDLKTRLSSLTTAMTANNDTEVARIAHSIKGGCAMVGLTRAREAASRLETSNLPVTWPTELLELRSALRELEGMLGDEFPA
jgi:CheY-like chemotaxis protein